MDICVGQLGLCHAYEHFGVQEFGGKGQLLIHDFFCYKWMASTAHDRYQGVDLVDAKNAPINHKSFKDEDVSIDMLYVMKTARFVLGGINFQAFKAASLSSEDRPNLCVAARQGLAFERNAYLLDRPLFPGRNS